ncbi:Carboxymuconolactone decarboxylase family protein [Maioricimonas rarisocia]|uniref:Carboxymuconolactone decarboxylase family protein n=1 Tax=Maioricimonas rarisocia TaxID=2528026 RepID=A0A517ZEM9_9PLAN|nr:carboxymuconolactone decarboxylase family protein [Maioricimonas rarisocia]QDU40916.1 Carboxymuconolactone decarboxylase family protein [Maioricimonas rarisocia]
MPQQRIDYANVAPEGRNALLKVAEYAHNSSIDRRLRALVELRVSQMNGCAYCIDMHATEARAAGESQQRLDCLCAWRETSFFDSREQAALAWAEAVNRLDGGQVSNDVYEAARKEFSEKELVDLTLIVSLMNVWNRMAISFHKPIEPRN